MWHVFSPFITNIWQIFVSVDHTQQLLLFTASSKLAAGGQNNLQTSDIIMREFREALFQGLKYGDY